MIKFRVKQEAPSLNDNELIALVKNHEFLYDTKNPDYRNLPLRASVWSSIAKDLNVQDRKLFLVSQFFDLCFYTLENVVQKRWKVLREKFSVAYRKYHLDGGTSSWNLYELCSFLEPFVNLKPDMKKELTLDQPVITEQLGPPKSPFDENTLTHLVRERPILYDKQHEDFRAGNLRKKAWLEIASIAGWDLGTVQKRWRVMRDRFVRELRRTKNIDSDSQINCSAFFRDMLFLARHVKSKKYEAEATDISSDISQDNWDSHEPIEDDSKLEIEQLETCIIPDSDDVVADNLRMIDETTDSNGRVVAYALDENNQYVECFGGAEQDVYETSDEDEEFYEDEEVVLDPTVYEHQLTPEAQEILTVENPSEQHWFKTRNSSENLLEKKRKISIDVSDEPSIKRESILSESSTTSSKFEPRLRISDSTEVTDEDAAFGKTIGLMLKKIPSHLKTSVKLNILQCLADFEIQHKLNTS